jgi:hypothetical protein
MTTAQERAEKISREWHGMTTDEFLSPKGNPRILAVIIAAEIEAAVKEAWGKNEKDHWQRVMRQAKSEAFEEAAKIAERCWENSKEYEGASIALAVRDSIRRRAAEGERGKVAGK